MIPLSFAQQRLWFMSRVDPLGWTYNLPLVLRLSGCPDVGALRAALGDVVGRHESLRTTFPVVDEQPVQCVVDGVDVDGLLSVVEVDAGGSAGVIAEAARHRFDLLVDTPLRGWLFTTGP